MIYPPPSKNPSLAYGRGLLEARRTFTNRAWGHINNQCTKRTGVSRMDDQGEAQVRELLKILADLEDHSATIRNDQAVGTGKGICSSIDRPGNKPICYSGKF
jgi:hypothetical protein